ncbi:cupin domain-containing protein [Chitinolyticbacter albus]|uniref:cupin domain-containing protein n=1 Tax=Chitinolyticbacter albus TaxID=2961951 RepID=UPI00210C1E98|nr:cupin domain-containing protein [Chitinolyticbacter albus]
MEETRHETSVIVLPAGSGRHYALGPMQASFLADGEETANRYSISEWWLDPHTEGPGAHHHDANDDVFYVIGGTMSFLAGDAWFDAAPGTFVRIPAGVTHDFANRGQTRAGVLNFYIPGGFEAEMPAIVDWFAANPSS